MVAQSVVDTDDKAAPVIASVSYSNNPADAEEDTLITVVMSETLA
jgi:hypothetical protein